MARLPPSTSRAAWGCSLLPPLTANLLLLTRVTCPGRRGNAIHVDPYLLDVRAKVTRGTSDSHGAWAQSGLSSNGSGFLECARRAEADAPKYMSMEEQARRFQVKISVNPTSTPALTLTQP